MTNSKIQSSLLTCPRKSQKRRLSTLFLTVINAGIAWHCICLWDASLWESQGWQPHPAALTARDEQGAHTWDVHQMSDERVNQIPSITPHCELLITYQLKNKSLHYLCIKYRLIQGRKLNITWNLAGGDHCKDLDNDYIWTEGGGCARDRTQERGFGGERAVFSAPGRLFPENLP